VNKYLQFDVEDVEVVDDNESSQFATAKIQAFSSGKNLHGLVCSEEVLQETASTIYNKPILYTIDTLRNDFYTHTEPDKSLICGFIVPDSASFERLPDSRLSLNVIARIWKKYAPKVIELFKKGNENKKKISVEMEMYTAEDRTDGFVDMLSFAYFGVTLLGDMVREASPGANMKMVSFSEEQREYDSVYVAEFSDKYDELDFSIPKKVKENAQDGLNLYAKYKKGGTSVALSVARFLIKSEVITPEKIEHISKHMLLHSEDDFSDKTAKSWIGWQLRGGNDALGWSKKLVESMVKIKERRLSYFNQEGELVTFPYKTIEDANPSLKSWKPPLSLSQINSIAKQADAIGGEYGWPTAIKHFKETHKVSEDGKSWVEKSKEESMADETKIAEEEQKLAEEKKLADAKFAEEEAKKKEDEIKFVEEEAKKKAEEDEAKKKADEAKEGEKEFSFANFANLVTYMEEEPEAEDEEAKMCKMAAEELKKEKADFAKVVAGMYAKMCKMSAKSAQMGVEMSALKEFKASVEAQQKKFTVDQTFRELEERVVIPDEARAEMVADAEKYSFAEIGIWQNNCKAKSFDFAAKIKESDESKVIKYALPFFNLPKLENNGSVWPAKS
jgi:hypothetical protein